MSFFCSRWQRYLLLGLLWLCCSSLGWGLALAFNRPSSPGPIAQVTLPQAPSSAGGLPANARPVDPIPSRYQPGFEAYLETCSSCHVALPPEVLPLESWQQILRRPDKHFGTTIPNLNRLTQLLIWDYVSTFSRPLPPNAPVPLYAEKSRFFKALHPQVDLPPDMTVKSCVACHPNVAQFDFRSLTPEWLNRE